jgi:hypothetical protein
MSLSQPWDMKLQEPGTTRSGGLQPAANQTALGTKHNSADLSWECSAQGKHSFGTQNGSLGLECGGLETAAP